MVAKNNIAEKSIKPLTFRTVSRLLDHIGLAMYSKFNKAIGELIVNGYDADATRVDVTIKYNKVIIEDNGMGMNEDDIRNNYMELGGDKKRTLFSKTPAFGRLPIGNKGIGKLAALGIAKRFTVITRKKGEWCFTYTIDREELDKKAVLEENYIDLKLCTRKKIKKQGTIIELTKIFPHIKIDKKELRGYLAREIPQCEKFQIYVDGEGCELKDIPGKTYKVEKANKICGKIEGEIVLAKSSFSNIIKHGILTTVRGRAVGEPSIFDVNKGGHKYARANYITGRIEVSDFDPEVNPDKIPVIKTDREGFNVTHPKYKAYHGEMTNLLIQILKQDEKEYYKGIQTEEEVKPVLKNVIDDIEAYPQKAKVDVKEEEQTSVAGVEEVVREVSKISPVGFKDERLRLELQRLKGLGTINLDNKEYKLTMRPIGADDLECRIDDEISVVNVNVDHPAYKQSIRSNSIELTVFRAIADVYACKVSRTAEEMYEKIDKLIRAQAAGMEKRRTEGKGRKKFR